MSSIILIGMPGVGKSSMGVVLAKILGMEFVDSDLVIQRRSGKLLKDIIASEGTEGFLELEDKINSEIDAEHAVIATGGSAVYGEAAMRHFKSIGRIVYLKASYQTIAARLGNLVGRGVAMKHGQTLEDIYNERIPLYERYADVTVDVDGENIDNIVKKIIVILNKN